MTIRLFSKKLLSFTVFAFFCAVAVEAMPGEKKTSLSETSSVASSQEAIGWSVDDITYAEWLCDVMESELAKFDDVFGTDAKKAADAFDACWDKTYKKYLETMGHTSTDAGRTYTKTEFAKWVSEFEATFGVSINDYLDSGIITDEEYAVLDNLTAELKKPKKRFAAVKLFYSGYIKILNAEFAADDDRSDEEKDDFEEVFGDYSDDDSSCNGEHINAAENHLAAMQSHSAIAYA